MTAFFDPSADAALVRMEFRDSPELATVAASAEYDVIDFYTKTGRDMRWTAGRTLLPTFVESVDVNLGPFEVAPNMFVMLRQFNVDPTVCDAVLAGALRRTIAGVIDWRMQQMSYDPLLTNKSAGDKHATMRANANEPYPRNWNRLLDKFDTRPKSGWCP